MARKNDFHTVDFFRKVRDEQAAMLQGKTHKEIIAFFAAFSKDKQRLNKQTTKEPQGQVYTLDNKPKSGS